MRWVQASRLSELTGLTLKAIQNRRVRGVWLRVEHYAKPPDGTYWYDTEAIDRWVGQSVEKSLRGSRPGDIQSA